MLGGKTMARILAAMAVLFFLLPTLGHAQEDAVGDLSKADQAAISQAIKAQLAALEHDDAARAFFYVSPLLQNKFGTAENFLDMVKTVYPAVYHPRDVQFRELEATYDGPVQKVFFFGPDGEPVLGLYFMQQQSDGSWKINGCELTPAPDIGV